jgi:outer membrane protein insertion porin family
MPRLLIRLSCLPFALVLVIRCASARAEPQEEPPVSAANAGESPKVTLSAVELEGELLEPRDKLLRFLGLGPGSRFGAVERLALLSALSQAGYEVQCEVRGTVLHIELKPLLVIRNVLVHGNFPLFDDEILRHLSVATGSRLDPKKNLDQFLDEEGARITSFLSREGYFGGSARVLAKRGPRPEWIDLDVHVDLGGWFRPYRLGSVLLEGKHPISEQELFDLFSHCCLWWGRFGTTRMREDARDAEKLLRERGYPAARVTPEFDFWRDADRATRRIRLPIKVLEKRRVEVRFSGNRNLSNRELRKELSLFTSGAYDEIELEESAKTIQRAYQQKGYFESKVTFHRKRVAPNADEVTFTIDEGPELKVRGVDFVSETGTSISFTQDELRDKSGIETKVFPRLGAVGLGEGGYVTSVQLQQDVERLRDFYRAQGFPEMQAHAEVARDKDAFGELGALGASVAGGTAEQHELYVRFFIHEGRRETVDHTEISFIGDHVFDEVKIRKVLHLTDGQPFNEAALVEDQKRILALYGATGRPYVQIDFGQSSWDPAHTRYTLRYRITEGESVRFGEIIIRGNFKTRDRVILADLPFRPGDPFELNKLVEGERNLQTHGIFNSARVVPVGLAAHRNPVAIVVNVQERYLERFGSLALAAGIATDKLPNYVYAAAGWVWSNFFGFGSQLELRVDTGFDANVWGASLRYTDLRAFGPGWRYDLTGFYRKEVTNRLGPLTTFGASTGLTRFFAPSLRGYLRYDFYVTQIGVDYFRLAGTNDLSSVSDNTNTGKVVAGLIWDRRVGPDGLPNPLATTKGWLLSASLGWASPYLGGDNQFLIVSGQALLLQPFRIRRSVLTLIANLRFDEGIPFGATALPVVERYFAGGDTATRGYEPDELKTEIIFGEVYPLGGRRGFRVVPQGGNARFLSTIELQFPIAKTFIGLPWQWVGAVFWDVGAIFDAPNLVVGSDFKHSLGVTLLRVLTPVGPLSLEYAYPLTQTLAEERWKTNPWYSHFPGRIHFNWGIPLSRL